MEICFTCCVEFGGLDSSAGCVLVWLWSSWVIRRPIWQHYPGFECLAKPFLTMFVGWVAALAPNLRLVFRLWNSSVGSDSSLNMICFMVPYYSLWLTVRSILNGTLKTVCQAFLSSCFLAFLIASCANVSSTAVPWFFPSMNEEFFFQEENGGTGYVAPPLLWLTGNLIGCYSYVYGLA